MDVRDDGNDGGVDRDRRDRAMQALMVSYQAGDWSAFDHLYGELAPGLRRLLRRFSRDESRVDDLLQEAFLQIHRSRHRYNPALPVRPWASAIARNVGLMEWRNGGRRRQACTSQLDENIEARSGSHEDALIAASRLRYALGRVTPKHRHAVLMHHLYGWTFQELARRSHVPSPVFRTRASRGIARMRGALADQTVIPSRRTGDCSSHGRA